jgi:hypothetical protein
MQYPGGPFRESQRRVCLVVCWNLAIERAGCEPLCEGQVAYSHREEPWKRMDQKQQRQRECHCGSITDRTSHQILLKSYQSEM